MKQIILFILLILAYAGVYAQRDTTTDSGILKFGFNYGLLDLESHFFHADGFEKMFYIEYSYPRHSVLAITPRVFGSFMLYDHINRSQEKFKNSASSMGVSLSASIRPAKWLNIDLGAVYLHRISSEGRTYRDRTYFSDAEDGHYAGIFTSLSAAFLKTQNLESGAHVELMLNESDGNVNFSSLQIGLYMGLKLNPSIPVKERKLRSTLLFGYNVSFFSSHDAMGRMSDAVTGNSVYLEYSYRLIPYLSLVPRVFTGLASKNEDFRGEEVSTYYTTYGAGIAARITPFPIKFNRLSIDAGIAFYDLYSVFNDRYSPHTRYYDAVSTYGLTTSVCLDIINTKTIKSGIRVDLLSGYYDGRLKKDVFQTGIYIGGKF